MRKLQQLQVSEALGTTLYFACTRGPDLGAVVPVREGIILGRHLGLCDPFTEQDHLSLSTNGHRVVCKDVGTTNRVKALRRVFGLRPGRSVRVGTNRWTLRARVGSPEWKDPQEPKKSRQLLVALRFVMPVVILGSLSRFFLPSGLLPFLLVGLGLAGGGLWLGTLFRRKRESDPAGLLLEVAALVANGQAPADPRPGEQGGLPYYLKPRSRRTGTAPPTGLAAVGPRARAYALWVGSQMFLCSHKVPEIGWARRVEDLTRTPSQVLPAEDAPGPLWESEMLALLEATKPPESRLAETVDLEEMLGTPTPELIHSRWEKSRTDPDSAWAVPLGLKDDTEPGAFHFDLEASGPHALVVGGTGSGKSEFLTSLVVALAASLPPEALRFVFIDYKGGAGLAHLEELPHVELSLTDLEGSQTPWLLRALRAEVIRRKEALRKAGFRSLSQWQAHGLSPEGRVAPPPALVVVADEVALLAQTSPEMLEQLGQIGAQGRSLGLHLVLASQRAGGVITADLRAVLDLRVALRCSEDRDSVDSIGDPSAAHLPRVPGRAVVQSQGRRTQVQAAHTADPPAWVNSIRMAHARSLTGKHRMLQKSFPSPLPETCGPFAASPDPSADAVQIGLYEHPSTADLEPLVWDGAPLLLVGPSQGDLSALAQRVANGFGDPAVWFGAGPSTGQEVPTVGESLYLLEETLESARTRQPDSPAPTVVIPQLSALLEQVGSVAGITASQGLLRSLTDLGERGAIRLVCTDTSPTTAAKSFPWRVFHLPAPDILTRPDYLSWLPGSRTAEERGGRVSRIPGRVIVITPELHGVHAQLSPAPNPDGRRDGNPTQAVSSATDLPCEAAKKAGSELTVVSEDPGDVGLIQTLCSPAHTFETTRHLGFSQWSQIPQGLGATVVSIEPTRETVRMIISPVSDAPLWPALSLPFPPRSGIARFGRRICRIEVPPKVPGSPVCDRSHVES